MGKESEAPSKKAKAPEEDKNKPKAGSKESVDQKTQERKLEKKTKK